MKNIGPTTASPTRSKSETMDDDVVNFKSLGCTKDSVVGLRRRTAKSKPRWKRLENVSAPSVRSPTFQSKWHSPCGSSGHKVTSPPLEPHPHLPRPDRRSKWHRAANPPPQIDHPKEQLVLVLQLSWFFFVTLDYGFPFKGDPSFPRSSTSIAQWMLAFTWKLSHPLSDYSHDSNESPDMFKSYAPSLFTRGYTLG